MNKSYIIAYGTHNKLSIDQLASHYNGMGLAQGYIFFPNI